MGVRVRAPFGPKRMAQGVVVKLQKKVDFKGKIRYISAIVDETPIFDKTLWELLNWVSRYYLSPMGQVMKCAVPQKLSSTYSPAKQLMVMKNEMSNDDLTALKEKAPKQFRLMEALEEQEEPIPIASLKNVGKNISAICRTLEKKGFVTISSVPSIPDSSSLTLKLLKKKITFSKEQRNVITELEEHLGKREFYPYLLHGATGSGKTEIYIHLAKQAEERKQTSIMLLPEIALTPQIAGRFRAVFGERVAIWHSRMSPVERAWTWNQICAGAYSVVVGARSAIFTPLRNVGLIIVDEEQEGSYKQESPAPRYQARDVALIRGKLSGALTVLAGATPSIESYYNKAVKKLNYIRMKYRYGKAKYPQVHIVDMIKEREETEDYRILFSRLLKEKIQDRLEKREQVILLQNRRGFSPIVSCRDCGYVEMCRHCKIPLTYHKVEKLMKCHYCNFTKMVPDDCKECSGTNLLLGGIGTQRVEESLIQEFPEMRLVRMDLDTTRRSGAHARILRKFDQGELDVLLGTQMIAKGLDFENVTLVGVINADTGLFLPDFRAGERTFQLIYQVAGRSGRGEKPGEVVIQTNNPDNNTIKLAAQLNIEKYYNVCLNERSELQYSPFSWMAKVEFAGKKRSQVERVAEEFLYSLKEKPRFLKILGPAPCPMEKIRGNYRYQIIFKSPKEKDKNGILIHKFLEKNLVDSPFMKKRIGVTTHVDVDPNTLL